MAFNAKWARDTAMASLPEHADLLEDIYETILDAVMNHELGVVITADRFPDVVVSHLTEQGFSVSSGATAQVISWAAAIDGAPKPPSVPLTIVSTDPDNGASEVNELGTITFTFDRELDDDVSEALADLSGLTGDNEGVEVDAYTVAGSTLTVVLNRNIVENGDDITVHLRSGSVTADDDGGLHPKVSITFTMHTFVPDPLVLVSTTPANGDTDVAARNTVTFDFDKPLAPAVTSNATITGADGVTVSDTTVNGSSVVVTLSEPLSEDGSTVTVTLPAGAVTAQDGGTQDSAATTAFTMAEPEPEPEPEPEEP